MNEDTHCYRCQTPLVRCTCGYARWALQDVDDDACPACGVEIDDDNWVLHFRCGSCQACTATCTCRPLEAAIRARIAQPMHDALTLQRLGADLADVDTQP
jgi:hypothetical protein